MIGAKIRCDHCGFVGDMAFSNVSKTATCAPSGWATVHTNVRIKGERDLKPEEKKKLKEKLKTISAAFHVCPACVFGTWEAKLDRLLGTQKDQEGKNEKVNNYESREKVVS